MPEQAVPETTVECNFKIPWPNENEVKFTLCRFGVTDNYPLLPCDGEDCILQKMQRLLEAFRSAFARAPLDEERSWVTQPIANDLVLLVFPEYKRDDINRLHGYLAVDDGYYQHPTLGKVVRTGRLIEWLKAEADKED